MYKHKNKCTNIKTNVQTYKKTYKHKNKCTNIQINVQTKNKCTNIMICTHTQCAHTQWWYVYLKLFTLFFTLVIHIDQLGCKASAGATPMSREVNTNNVSTMKQRCGYCSTVLKKWEWLLLHICAIISATELPKSWKYLEKILMIPVYWLHF